MRTTVDIPDDLHHLAKAIAKDKSWTISEAVAWLMRRGAGEESAGEIGRDPVTGWPVIRLGKVITSEDVAALEDEW